LPVTTWNKDRSRLTVEWKDQKDDYALSLGADGRTRFALSRDGKGILASSNAD